jgi:hypothetical protein
MRGRARLNQGGLRFMSIIAYAIAVCWVVLGISLIAGA